MPTAPEPSPTQVDVVGRTYDSWADEASGAETGTAGAQPTNCADDAAIAAALQADEQARARSQRRSHSGHHAAHRVWQVVSVPRTADGSLEPPRRSWKRQLAIRLLAVVLAAAAIAAGIYMALLWHLGSPPGASPAPSEPLSFAPGEFKEISKLVFDGTNNYRASKGLDPVEWNDGIAMVASQHAAGMAAGAEPFSHDGFRERAARFPLAYSGAGENLARCGGVPEAAPQDAADCAVQGWINSPGHEKNMVDRWNVCGIGTAHDDNGQFFITQLFAEKLL